MGLVRIVFTPLPSPRANVKVACHSTKKRPDYASAGLLDATEKKLLTTGMPHYYSHIVALFDRAKLYSYVIDFSRLGLQFAAPAAAASANLATLRTELHSRLFNAALQTSQWEIAYTTLNLFTDVPLQVSSVRSLVTRMCESNAARHLVALPFIGLHKHVDDVLVERCQAIVDVEKGVQYHKILYAWRIQRNDYRGAALVSHDRLETLQKGREDSHAKASAVTGQFVALINALSCVDPKQAWILAESVPAKSAIGKSSIGTRGTQPAKRRLITLQDVRKAYQAELDRQAAIDHGQFAFGDVDEEGEDGDGDIMMDISHTSA